MENRRLFSFLLLSVATVWLWGTVVAPKLMPPQPRKPAVADAAAQDLPAEQTDPTAEVPAAAEQSPAAAESGAEAAATPAGTPPIHPPTQVTLGSLDPASGYALEVRLSSAGASILDVTLTDPQFRDLRQLDRQARIVGNNATADRSFSLAVDVIDQQLAEHQLPPLESLDWKLDEQQTTPEGMWARFSCDAPDGTLRVEKTFRLARLQATSEQLPTALRTDPSGYTVQVEVRAINLSEQPQTLTYELQGPVGMLLENEEHTSKYRDIKIEFLAGGDDVTRTPKEVVSSVQDLEEAAQRPLSRTEVFAKLREQDKWTGVFRYAGIDVQFFAALVAPLDERPPEQRQEFKWIDRTYPMVVEEDRRDPRRSDISFRMVSSPLTLQPQGTDDAVVHRYAFFVGPKRSELLDPLPLAASRVLDYGQYFGFIARGMHWLLDLFHGTGMPYVLAIISLTVLVRGCMFPLSRKQAISAARMKDLQPKLAELKTKFGDDKEKLARAQMELWRKHNINPLGGCLPLFFQLPIFIGLYTSLNTAIDLRLSRFLWVENLAAPDALFRLPFELPFSLGADFSLLPCVTVVLFLIQQKMFMPPAVDEQQLAQQKMMNFMTIFMGVMFWHQPAGLCVYFIASSLWGIAERTMLGSTATAAPATTGGIDDVLVSGDTEKPSVRVVNDKDKARSEPKPPGFMQRLMDLAQQAKENAEKTQQNDSRGRKKKRDR